MSDNDSLLNVLEFVKYYYTNGINCVLKFPSYNPESNGSAEHPDRRGKEALDKYLLQHYLISTTGG